MKGKVFCFFLDSISTKEMVEALILVYYARRRLYDNHYSSIPLKNGKDELSETWHQRMDVIEESLNGLDGIVLDFFIRSSSLTYFFRRNSKSPIP
jgi:hypothetical protein